MAEASHVHKKVKKKFSLVFLKGTQQKAFINLLSSLALSMRGRVEFMAG